jgi:Predicted pyridoxal phosphate-dependent enzyme apparently involved in regulation of cell wall biogenesis
MNYSIPMQISSRRSGLANRRKEFEYRIADYLQVPYCVTTESRQAALQLALGAAGLQEGEHVLCATLGYNAIVQQIWRWGAVPVFVDINPNTFNLDAFCLEYAIAKHLRTKPHAPKVLITLDLFGLPCNYARIEKICEKHQITLIEDMTQALGAGIEERNSGTFGRFAVGNVLWGSANLSENGIVCCHTPGDYLHLLELRDGWQRCAGGHGGPHAEYAQAILLQECLKEAEQMRQKRYAVAQRYQHHLAGRVRTQLLPQGMRSAYHRFAVALPNAALRVAAMEHLMQHRVPCSIYYPEPLYLYTPENSTPLAEEQPPLVHAPRTAQKLLGLPLHPYISNRVVDRVSGLLLEAVASSSDAARQEGEA